MSLKYNVSYEVASTIFLIILLFYIRLQYDIHSKSNKEFRKLAWLGLIATILDVTTAVTISYASPQNIDVSYLIRRYTHPDHAQRSVRGEVPGALRSCLRQNALLRIPEFLFLIILFLL